MENESFKNKKEFIEIKNKFKYLPECRAMRWKIKILDHYAVQM